MDLIKLLAAGALGRRGGGNDPSIYVRSVNADNFQISLPGALAPSGRKTTAIRYGRNNGSNDAGAAHEPYRIVGGYIVDTPTDLYSVNTGGWATFAGSNGARDLARKRGTPVNTFGGSVHGGETNVSHLMSLDGNEIDGLFNVEGRLFRNLRNSLITWGADGSVASVAMDTFIRGLADGFQTDMAMVHASDAVMGNVGTPKEDYLTSTLLDYRYSELDTESGGVVSMGDDLYEIDVSERAIRLRDPLTGDYVDYDLTIEGATLSRLHVWHSLANNYTKLYASSPGGVLSPISVTQRARHHFADIPQFPAALPFTDSFPGSALGAHWKRIAGDGSDASVSGGDLTLAYSGSGTADEFVMPLHLPEGPKRVSLSYISDTSNTFAQAGITRSDTVNADSNNPIVAMTSLNSGSETTLNLDFNITAGQTPSLHINVAGFAGRSGRIHEVQVIEL